MKGKKKESVAALKRRLSAFVGQCTVVRTAIAERDGEIRNLNKEIERHLQSSSGNFRYEGIPDTELNKKSVYEMNPRASAGKSVGKGESPEKIKRRISAQKSQLTRLKGVLAEREKMVSRLRVELETYSKPPANEYGDHRYLDDGRYWQYGETVYDDARADGKSPAQAKQLEKEARLRAIG